MPRNKGISTIRATKCRTVEIPFLLSRKQIYRSVWRGFLAGVENTDLLSGGREYRSNGVALLMEMGTGKTITSVGTAMLSNVKLLLHDDSSRLFFL